MTTKRGRKFQEPNIININSKLKEIGLNIECVNRIEDIILFLIYYLGVMTIEQLCVLFDVLETSIKTSIARIIKNSDVIEIKKDDVNNIYYLPTRKTLSELKKFCDVKENRNYRNIKHLSKVNDFFINIFKSYCDKVNIEYEKNMGNEEFVVRVDAIINVEKDGNEYEFIVEQDNNTEKVTRIFEKIENYFNIILHEKLCSEKIRYYVFRFDVLFDIKYLSKYNEFLVNSFGYMFLRDNIDTLKESYTDVKNGEFSEEYYKKRLRELNVNFSNESDVFLRNISFVKTKWLKRFDKFKRAKRLEISRNILKERISKVKESMLKEFNVYKFDNDSIDTLYYDITGNKEFGSVNSKLEGKDILLRTNIICGDSRLDYTIMHALFEQEHFLENLLKHVLGSDVINFDEIKIKQVFMVVGNQTLCFSNFITSNINKTNRAVDFALFIPAISMSDYLRIEYLLKLDLIELHNSLINETHFFILTSDKQTYNYYKKKIEKFQSNKIDFRICYYPWDELDTLED